MKKVIIVILETNFYDTQVLNVHTFFLGAEIKMFSKINQIDKLNCTYGSLSRQLRLGSH